MPANVEIKARLDDAKVDLTVDRAVALAKGYPAVNGANGSNGHHANGNGVHHHDDVTILEQSDTFFNCVLPGRRLKLREEIRNGKPNQAQLIVYFRPDQIGPKFCDYSISRFDQAEAQQLKSVLRQSLGVRGEVIKTRKLIMVGQTRVHIDNVKGLGNFMELEVCLREDQSAEDGQKIAEDILRSLDIPLSNLVAPAYMDLLLEKAQTCCTPQQPQDIITEI